MFSAMSRPRGMAALTTAAMFTAHHATGSADAHDADVVVGHGLGDLAALVAAGALDPETGRSLADLRASLLAEAAAARPGGMLAVHDSDADAAARCVGALSGLTLARHDSPTRVVLAGTREQLAIGRLAADELRVTTVHVTGTGALHSPVMGAAAERFSRALAGAQFRPPEIGVYSAVTAAPVIDPRAELVRGLVAPVLWQQTIRALAGAGVARFVQSGPGRLLCDLVESTIAGAETRGGPDPEPAHA